jgi:hypothetical protein
MHQNSLVGHGASSSRGSVIIIHSADGIAALIRINDALTTASASSMGGKTQKIRHAAFDGGSTGSSAARKSSSAMQLPGITQLPASRTMTAYSKAWSSAYFSKAFWRSSNLPGRVMNLIRVTAGSA